MSSSGGIVTQPILGRTADVWGYPASFLVSGAISAIALPFLAKARRIEPSGPDDPASGRDDDAEVHGPAAGRVEYPV